MTYFIDFMKNLTKKSNIGVFIYLILNTLLVISFFSDGFNDLKGILIGVAAYVVSLVIALSPAGEWVLRWQTGCREISRQEHVDRLYPLFREVLSKAREIDPSIHEDVQLFISDDEEPNAFATGRKTICLTNGFLNYTDDQIKATFAHELGHLAHKDTDLILTVSVGNLIVTGIFIMYRIFVNIMGFFIKLASGDFGALFVKIFISGILGGAIWLWTKMGTLLVMHSSRQNEYLADEFALKCGYGDGLAAVLESFDQDNDGSKGLWANLVSTHPVPDARIAKLQELASNCSGV